MKGRKLKIGVIGTGNMGKAILSALRSQSSYSLFAYDIDREKLKSLPSKIKIIKDNKTLISLSQIIILAIKPQDINSFLYAYKDSLKKYRPLIITIAAGVGTRKFEKYAKLAVVRVMPNIAAKVKASISFISPGKYAKHSDLMVTKNIFSSVGETIVVKESFLDKVTSISGSGPGYIYYIMDVFYKRALKFGFNKREARKMVLMTFLGAVKLAISEEDLVFQMLVKQVASPKGTTEAGLKVFRERNLEEIIDQAVISAYKRARELSSQYK